jgi:hypothetical protein
MSDAMCRLAVLGLFLSAAGLQGCLGMRSEPAATVRAGADRAGSARECEDSARRLWDRDVLEALRYARRGAALGDGECCLQYLALVDRSEVTLSQRQYARLFIEKLLRRGPLRSRTGEDVTAQIYYQLCWSWRTMEPRDPQKVRESVERLYRAGPTPEMAQSEFLKGSGVAERGGAAIAFDPVTTPSWDAPAPRPHGDFATVESKAFGIGNDRLWLATRVLAFLVNSEGEPSFRGDRLWIRNCGSRPIYYTSGGARQLNREVPPGGEETRALDGGELVTEVDLKVRFWQER